MTRVLTIIYIVIVVKIYLSNKSILDGSKPHIILDGCQDVEKSIIISYPSNNNSRYQHVNSIENPGTIERNHNRCWITRSKYETNERTIICVY